MTISKLNAGFYSTTDVCREVGISSRQLEYWILIGIVSPRLEKHGIKFFKRFNIQDIEILKQIKLLTDEGFLVSRALEKVKREYPQLFNGR
ncbi:MAG TPA: MerR family transcriptional regulator [Nitrospiria bacterium]|nr:MerR family transcriptional regulator [Nitrospiria bacterium]